MSTQQTTHFSAFIVTTINYLLLFVFYIQKQNKCFGWLCGLEGICFYIWLPGSAKNSLFLKARRHVLFFKYLYVLYSNKTKKKISCFYMQLDINILIFGYSYAVAYKQKNIRFVLLPHLHPHLLPQPNKQLPLFFLSGYILIKQTKVCFLSVIALIFRWDFKVALTKKTCFFY